jgi:DNA-binding MarR family transcriptional regulator
MPQPRRKLAADTWGALLQVHAGLVPLIDREVRERTGLPLAWYDILLELSAASEGRLRMSELAERVVLSRTRVSRLVDELHRAGLVCRVENPDDRRSTYCLLTDAGLRRFKAAAPIYLAAIESRFAGGLTDRQLKDLQQSLLSVRARLDRRP